MGSSQAVVFGLIILCTFYLVQGDAPPIRYVFYDVNPGEGFNLRRDVYMRIAILVRMLNQTGRGKYILVLPPWGRLYHWQSRELGYQTKIQWREFFDVASLNRFVPVIDMDKYLENNDPLIDNVLYLQNYKEGWEDGKFEEKFDYRECIDPPRYKQEEGSGLYTGWFWDYSQFRAKSFEYAAAIGKSTVLKDHLLSHMGDRVMLDRAEQVLHVYFGDENYWAARRSMRFSKRLVDVANEYREKHLSSSDEADETTLALDWEDHQPNEGAAKGGPYMCVHLRRKDYAHSRRKDIPSVKGAAKQVAAKLNTDQLEGVQTVFVATDAPREEFLEFKSSMEELVPEIKVEKFEPSEKVLWECRDGGVAIIDQIICSHARYFVGSAESTFSFRIQEEREIMGFSPESTFNKLCPEDKLDCKSSQWRIRYPTNENARLNHQEL